MHGFATCRSVLKQLMLNPAEEWEKDFLGGAARPSKPPCFYPGDQADLVWPHILRLRDGQCPRNRHADLLTSSRFHLRRVLAE